MSAGAFVISRYAASYGNGTNVHPIRVQPETLLASFGSPNAIANTPPTEAANSPISAVVSRGKRAKGLNARKVSFRFTDTPPEGYLANAVLTIPWLTAIPATFVQGLVGSYLGVATELVSVSPESVR